MRVGLITADPGHPLLAAATALLTAPGAGHRVEVLDPATASAPADPADVYLLKARTPRALALARGVEAAGARVVNSAAATRRCQDRTAMAEDALRAGLPFAPTRTYASAADLAASPPVGPVVVKSRHSRKGDVVVRLEGAARIRDFAASAPYEPVVVQDFVPNPGWDHKLWAIGPQVFAALRRSELAAAAPGGGPVPLADLPPAWPALVRRVGQVFGLHVYGVDVIDTGGGHPLIVDVNAFPGVRNQPGAPEALADLVSGLVSGLAEGVHRSPDRARLPE
ncbi:ATP-grasp domain-containing protein [Actinacidiphila paucisporea]|uniref:Ribosomal protein S6--L-glutamate ligase n=1 Tax=Actinacidiphila paucisporea TaxID=310782 RepID=A0A1M7HYW0_9ACTN|nr:alpha-L-glutamate ligase [Actinacidiphila paucisporea]SHM33736.1 ribosomal protein S6--L-glutamate ligase [Actinacidiphila paucisporea]